MYINYTFGKIKSFTLTLEITNSPIINFGEKKEPQEQEPLSRTKWAIRG